ncbi:MAG: hypothetical protein Ct9H300mP21_09540 [Pseudomonadota bacterium]|nr:MAG: hypothetical protein Ct9H300mP21_09540 [Pseudomonadota bacterium]
MLNTNWGKSGFYFRSSCSVEIKEPKVFLFRENFKFKKPFKSGEKSFFYDLHSKDENNFWNEAKKSGRTLLKSGSPHPEFASNSSASMGKVQSGSLGFLQRQQQIIDVETYVDDLQKKIKNLK